MINHAKHLTKSKFARNVAIVATGTAGAQAITMAFAPVITRIYGPEAFGVLGAFTAILMVLSPIAALSYPIAIVLPKRDDDAVGLAKLSIGIALAISMITAFVLWCFKDSIVGIFNLQAVEAFIMLLPLAMLFSAAMAIMSQWLIRKKLFKITARVAVLQAIWLNSAKAGIGLFSPVAAVLVVLATFGSVLHALMLWVGVNRNAEGRLVDAIRRDAGASRAREVAWQYRDFAYYRTPQIVLNAASQSMPVLILASFFGPASAGFYALGRMVMAMPATLIGNAVGDVFYPRISEAAHNGEKMSALLLKSTLFLLIVGMIPFGTVFVFGPQLFSLVFGQEWVVAGEYARWISLWLLFMFANQPAVKTLPVLRAQGFHLIFTVFTIGFRAVALFAGYKVFDSDLISVVLFCVTSMILNVTLIMLTYAMCVARDKKLKAVH